MRTQRVFRLGAFALGAVVALLPRLVSAHHSQAGYETDDKIRTLKGVVAEYRWRNPHVVVVWDVKDDSGKVVQWAGELPSVTSVIAQGLSKSSLKQGEEIVVTGLPSRAGTECLVRTIKRADGTLVYPLKENGPREGTSQ
jgi:Family of unknown function (DUF6152)